MFPPIREDALYFVLLRMECVVRFYGTLSRKWKGIVTVFVAVAEEYLSIPVAALLRMW